MRNFTGFCWLYFIIVLFVASPPVAVCQQFRSQQAGFFITVNGIENPYEIVTVFVLPNEQLKIKVKKNKTTDEFRLYSPEGKIIPAASGHRKWRVPSQAGLYQLKMASVNHQRSTTLNVFVMVPFSRLAGEYLNGYRIGRYPQIALKGLAIYKPPRGFVEVTPQNENTLISPHFKLKQFLCKQSGGYPKYLVLQEKLLLKLELILGKVNEKGYRCDTFHVMSGYRTPYYNKAIGNVTYSRHIYGGASDIFIDENPKDDTMDDLNQDGKIDYKDAAGLYRIIDRLYGKRFYDPFLGGLAWYKKNSNHGPFVHVDVRGRPTRWGD
ncbi:MAG: peptidase M15A [Deltaproteobacteria bacterium]|nr:peptidase M15A [Deltaproteobacteria bacterium]